MKKLFTFIFLFYSSVCFAYDFDWCQKNGGRLEFNFNYSTRFNCVTDDIYNTPYVKEIYDIVCIPCFSSVTKNENPKFLKLVSEGIIINESMFDEYNYKTTENELIRYI